MVALMITTLVAALRERKAQAAAAQQFAPAAVEDGEMGGEVPQDGFGDDPMGFVEQPDFGENPL